MGVQDTGFGCSRETAKTMPKGGVCDMPNLPAQNGSLFTIPFTYQLTRSGSEPCLWMLLLDDA